MPITDANGDSISPLGGWRILADSTARKTINLEEAPSAVRKITIEDTVGDAGTNNITVNANGDELIDGNASLTISTDNQRVVLESTGTGWTVISTAVSGFNTNDSLDLICDTFEMRDAFSLPTADGTAGQLLSTDGSGNLSWTDNDGCCEVKGLNSKTAATGEVEHDCSDSHTFYHTNISGDFTPNFTNINISNGQLTKTSLILDQGSTGYIPEALKVNGTGSVIHWEGDAIPTASINAVDLVKMDIFLQSNTFSTVATYTKHAYEVAAPSGGGSGASIPANALLFLDASDANSYGGSGATWTDLSGEGNHATLVNTPTFSSSDKWFDFAKTSSQHATVPSGFADFTSGATFFFVADLDAGDHWERLIDFSGGSSTPLNVGRNQTTSTMTLEYYNPGKTGTSSNIILSNTLASYCVTTDGTNAKFYRNGTLITTNSFTLLPDNNARTQNYIGRSRSTNDSYFDGQIAVVGIFNRALTASEISDLHDHYDGIYSL